MKILITGGTGYIGSYIAEDLAAHGHQVAILARGLPRGDLRDGRLLDLQSKGIRFLCADLSRPGDILRQVTEPDFDVIVHGVCSFLEPTQGESLTLRAMQEIITFGAECKGLRQLIDLGNGLVLKDAGSSDVPDEDYPCIPYTLHGKNKLAAERMLQASGLPWVVLRVGQVYGGTGSSFDWVILDGIRKGSLPLPGNGKNRYGLVHVADVALGTRLVIEQGHTNLVLNIASADTQVTQGEIFDLVADAFGVKRAQRIPRAIALSYAWLVEKLARLRGQEPAFIPDMIRVLSANCVFSIQRAEKLLGYQPAYPQTLAGIRAAYADVFAGKSLPFNPAGRLAEVRGTQSNETSR